MKLKYYLKGLGVGIIFATLVLSISFAVYGNKISEAKIVEEALELGMVWPDKDSSKGEKQSTTPAESNTTTAESESVSQEESSSIDKSTEQSTPIETTTPEETTTPVETTTPEETTTPAETTTPEETTTPVETTTPEETTTPIETTAAEPVTSIIHGKAVITVQRGMNSVQVAKLLKSVGLINSVSEFDAYIVSQGYGGRIQIGRHEIPMGASYDEIIKIICGLK